MQMSVAGTPERADDLAARASRGDRDAFAEIVSAHHASMLRLAFVICGDREMADDAVQNAWDRAWRKLGSLRDETRLRAWLLSVAGNEARQALRRQRTRTHREGAVTVDGARPSVDRELRMDLASALARLSPEARHLLALRYVLGLTSPEVAQLLGISAAGVRTRSKRLIDRLRGELTDV